MTNNKKRGSPSRTPTSASTPPGKAKPAAAPKATPPVKTVAAERPETKAAAPGKPAKSPAVAPERAPGKAPTERGPEKGSTKAAPNAVTPKAVAPKAVAPKAVDPKAVAPKAGGAAKAGDSKKPADPKAGGASPKKASKAATADAAAPTKPAGPPKPKTFPKGGPGKADLKRYRDALLARRRELLSSSKELAAEALQAGGGDFSVDHMADHGSDNYEQDFNLKLLEGEAGQLADIRDALAKLDGKGDLPFGLCEACADEPQGRCPTCPWIPASRLDAIPQARLCVQMKEREESRG